MTVLYIALFLMSPIIFIIGFRILFAVSVFIISAVLTLGLFGIDKTKEKRGKNEKSTY